MSSKIQEPDFDAGELRSFLFEALQRFKANRELHGGGLDLFTLALEAQSVAGQRGRIDLPDGEPRNARMRRPTNAKRMLSLMTALFNEGILAWGNTLNGPDTTKLTITEYGESVIAAQGEANLNPHDPDGYLARFRARIPDAGELILFYLGESLECYRYGRFIASSVMLGVSSEAAFDELFDALVKYPGPHQSNLQKMKEQPSTRKKFDEAIKLLDRLKPAMPKELERIIENELRGLFTLIRRQRNDSGHPTGESVTREEMWGYLQVFPMYCHYIYRLKAWLEAKPSS